MAIKLPMDANGRVIPLDTTMMYRNDNSQFHVTDFFYEARPDKWFARSGSECIETNKLYLESKKKVAEYRAEDVLVNRPKKTTPQNAAQANKGVTLSTLPEYATPNEWAEDKLMVTITLAEYRELVRKAAVLDEREGGGDGALS